MVEDQPSQLIMSSGKKRQECQYSNLKEREEELRRSSYHQEMKENSVLRFNYLTTDKNLSTIREDNREHMRESHRSSTIRPFEANPILMPVPMHVPMPLPLSNSAPIFPKYRYHEDIFEAESNFQIRLETE